MFSKTNRKTLLWDDTDLKPTLLLTEEIKQLLITRGAKRKDIKMRKLDLILYLKKKYEVELKTSFQDLTKKELLCELTLLRLDNTNANKNILIDRLKDGMEDLISRRQWISLMELPSNGLVITTNNDEMLFLSVKDGIYKYLTSTDKWEKWKNYASIETFRYFPFSCYNNSNNTIYSIYDHHRRKKGLYKINYDTKQTDIIENLFNAKNGAEIICVEGKLHVIGGSNKHLIFDETNQRFDEYYSFDEYKQGFWGFGLVNIPSKNMLLLFGGYDINIGRYTDCIYSYCTLNKQWKKLKMKLPKPLGSMGCVITNNQKYILIFGGGNNNISKENKIYVLNVEEMKIINCDLRCPMYNYLKALIVTEKNDTLREELIVFGFVRKCWNDYDIGLDMFPPQYIVKLIQLWFAEDCVHLFDVEQPCNHWKIAVHEIINNLGSHIDINSF